MKTVFSISKAVAIVTVLIVFLSCEKETVINSSDYPTEISAYITEHFKEHTILQLVEEKDGFEKTYDVTLDGGVFLEFNKKKEVIDIAGTSKLPDSVIPEKILEYVANNYNNNVVTGWELEDKNQQVSLDNDLDLEFDMSGTFLRIDS